MKLIAEIANTKHKLQIKRDAERVIAEVDGRRYEIEARALKSGSYSLLSNNRVFECHISRDTARREAFNVIIGSHAYSLTLSDPKRLRGSTGAAAHADGSAQIIAPMPGKIVRVLVEKGAEVKAGQGLVIVEAMKMQNEMKSPKDGIITELQAQAGQTVNGGDVLAVVE